jgi:hypothetical protein
MALHLDRAAAPVMRHVVARTRGRRLLYPDAPARAAAAKRIAEICVRFRLRCIVWCVTERCLHLVVRGAASAITLATEELVTARLRHGHCLSTVVQQDLYLLEVVRHTLDAPVRAGHCRRVIDWSWSSARESFGLCAAPAWLDLLPIYDLLGPRDDRGPQRLRRFLAGGA